MASPQTPPLDFDPTESRAYALIVSAVLLQVISTVGVVLRFYARGKAGAELWVDDWLVLAGYVPFMVKSSANYLMVRWSGGRHVEWVLENHPEHMKLFLKCLYAVEMLCPLTVGSIKCSICFLYIRIFGTLRSIRWCSYALIILTAMWAAGTFFVAVFQCSPIRDAWDPEGRRATCVDIRRYLVGQSIPNAVLSVLVLLAPMQPIWTLHFPLRKKILVLAMLGLGASDTAFSFVRLETMMTVGTFDVTWDYTTPIIWSIVEPAVGLLCACVPVMGTLVPKGWMQSIRSGKEGDQNAANALQTIPGSSSRATGASVSAQISTAALCDEDAQWRNRQTSTVAIDVGNRKLWAFT